MSRLPRTSYGYPPPPDARAKGWTCAGDDCGTGDEPAPRSWPFPCPRCGGRTDPRFEEPWAHEAEGYELRHQLTIPDRREYAQGRLAVWGYKDATLRRDRPAAAAAWQAYVRDRRRSQGDRPRIGFHGAEIVRLAALAGDVDRAAREVLSWYPNLETRGLEDDSRLRADARSFVTACIHVLDRDESFGQPWEAELDAAMHAVRNSSEDVSMPDHAPGIQRIRDRRAFRRSQAAIAATRRSVAVLLDDLPDLTDLGPALTAPSAAECAAAVESAQVHDTPGPLDELIRRLDETGRTPALAHLLRARRRIVTGGLVDALAELDAALKAGIDTLTPRLAPHLHATRGLVLAHADPASLGDGIAACRAGRRLGLGSGGRGRGRGRTTVADVPLIRLLLWRAEQKDPAANQAAADVREAVDLARRLCRPWHSPTSDERLLLHEARAAQDALSTPSDPARRHEAWRHLVAMPASAAARARLALAWADWALDRRDPERAADAYQSLVGLVVRDSAERPPGSAKQRVLAAAQEFAEEAGYWLARALRYQEAAVALETGRAIGLTEALGPVGGAAGLPATDVVTYADITAETVDGPLVYLAAAKAGGFALVVSAHYDPQYVELPGLDYASVAALVETVVPAAGSRSGPVHPRGRRQDAAAPRDASAAVSAPDAWPPGLRELWWSGLNHLMVFGPQGRILTLIPVGLLSLLPVHAATGVPLGRTAAGDWNQPNALSPLRYAPNVRSLRRCRDIVRDSAGQSPSLLAADVPDGYRIVPEARLRYVGRETDEVTRRWTGRTARALHACTWEEFRTAAESHSVWHLACHGSADPRAILDSRLYFADREVSLEELRRELPAGPRRLAVLSACETNLTDSALPNEVVGLPSALLQLGFAGVVAAAWPVDDLATAYLMAAFYDQWCGQGAEPAVALSRAQRWLRTAARDDLRALMPGVEPGGEPHEQPYQNPLYWAAFAYTGA